MARALHPENNLLRLHVPFLTMVSPASWAPYQESRARYLLSSVPAGPPAPVVSAPAFPRHVGTRMQTLCSLPSVSSCLPPHVGDWHMCSLEFTDLTHLIS